MKDIRFRSWMEEDTRISKALKLIIEAEDILMDFDDYQLWKDSKYCDFEEFHNQLAYLRSNLLEYVDKTPDVLKLDKKIDQFFIEERKNSK